MSQTTEREEKAATALVDAAYRVHKALGPGLPEHIYEVCLCRELRKKGVAHCRQIAVPIVYDGEELEGAFRLDVLIDEVVVCELKAVESTNGTLRSF